MQDQANALPARPDRVPWNTGKVTGAKSPLRPKHVWSIRTKLQIEGRAIAASGYTADRATVRQRKTGWPVRFELSEQTRQAVDDYLKAANKGPGQFLFTGRRGAERSMTTRQSSARTTGESGTRDVSSGRGTAPRNSPGRQLA
jgi:hypothetical protein